MQLQYFINLATNILRYVSFIIKHNTISQLFCVTCDRIEISIHEKLLKRILYTVSIAVICNVNL